MTEPTPALQAMTGVGPNPGSGHPVAPVSDIPPGGRKIVEIAGRSIGVFNVGGQFFALRNRCPHQGGPLCQGRLAGLVSSAKPGEYEYLRDGEFLRCPWHGWEFDLRTGQSWFDPAGIRVRTYPVSVEPVQSDPAVPGLTPGPYQAETYEVTVEEEWVVVHLRGSPERPSDSTQP
jgi:3-phenylpropionate/trans-cinnamate dioxygenase ferredoxin subunit